MSENCLGATAPPIYCVICVIFVVFMSNFKAKLCSYLLLGDGSRGRDRHAAGCGIRFYIRWAGFLADLYPWSITAAKKPRIHDMLMHSLRHSRRIHEPILGQNYQAISSRATGQEAVIVMPLGAFFIITCTGPVFSPFPAPDRPRRGGKRCRTRNALCITFALRRKGHEILE